MMIDLSLFVDLLAFTGVVGYLVSLIFFRSALDMGSEEQVRETFVVKRSLIGQHIVPKSVTR